MEVAIAVFTALQLLACVEPFVDDAPTREEVCWDEDSVSATSSWEAGGHPYYDDYRSGP